MKNFIQSLKLRLSDLFLLIGFLPFIVFLIFGQLFMQYFTLNNEPIPLGVAIPCFIVSLTSWAYYIYLEFKAGNKPNNIISCVFIFLAVLGVITVFVQPQLFRADVICRTEEVGPATIEAYGNVVPNSIVIIVMEIPLAHFVFFAMDIVLILMFIYIGLFIFPKRFTSINFIKYLGYALFLLILALLLYSLFFEANCYVGFIKVLLGKGVEGEDFYTYSVKSFIIHRNAYGMVLMMGIIFACINHSIDQKWWYYPLIVLFFINMVFTYCKTGLIISLLIIAIYVIYRLIITYNEHKKRNKIIFISFASATLLVVLLGAISYFTNGKFLSPLYSVINSVVGSDTLDTRTYIWDNSYQLLQNGWWIIGRGFGLYNVMLLPMNVVNNDVVFPAHSAYVGLLAEGGIFYLLAYLALLVYSGVIVYKSFKKNPGLTITMSFGVIAFVLYGTIEAIQYLVYVFLFPLFILYNINNKEEAK